MREPWKIPYVLPDRARLARGAVNPITQLRRVRLRVKAASLQAALPGGRRARSRLCS